MEDILMSIFISIVLWGLGGLVIYQALTRKKEGSKIWKVYNEVSRELGLIEKEESTAGYGLPDIVGKIKGRRVFIHPIVGKGVGGIAKTAFAVEHKIRFDKRIMISSIDTSLLLLGKFKYPIDVFHLNSTDYMVTSQAKTNNDLINQLFTINVLSKFNTMVTKEPNKFFSLILESGIAILYTINWEEEKNVLKKNLLDIVELAEQMEKNATNLDPNIDNKLFRHTTKKGLSKTVDIGLSIIITFLGIIVGLVTLSLSDIQNAVVSLNIGVVLILMGITRVYAALKMNG